MRNFKFKIPNPFKQKAPKLAKHPDFSKMEYKFTDSKGRRYYQYLIDYNIPMERFNQFKRFMMELQNVMTRDEQSMFLLAMKKELAKDKIDVGKIGFLVNEMDMRKEFLVHEDIMFAMAGALYIREDQHPQRWDDEQEQAKAAFLREEAQSDGNLYDFFEKASLGKYMPYLRDFKGTLPQFFSRTNRRRKAMRIMMKEDFGIDPKSLKHLESKMMST